MNVSHFLCLTNGPNHISILLFLILWVSFGKGQSIDNKLLGDPTIRCGQVNISITGFTKNPFSGTIYFRNHRRTPDCFATYDPEIDTMVTYKPTLKLQMSSRHKCGFKSTKNELTGFVELENEVIFGYHHNFVTKADQKVKIKCLIQDVVSVPPINHHKEKVIKDLPVTGQAEDVLVDFKIYKILQVPSIPIKDNHTNVVFVATRKEIAKDIHIGDSLSFVWHTTKDTEIYGVKILECFGENLDGKKIKLLENGCSVDSAIVSDVSYHRDSSEATATSVAFHFPESEEMWIKCAVQVCIKKNAYQSKTEDKDFSSNNFEICSGKEELQCKESINRSEEFKRAKRHIPGLFNVKSFLRYPSSKERIKRHIMDIEQNDSINLKQQECDFHVLKTSWFQNILLFYTFWLLALVTAKLYLKYWKRGN